MKKKILIKESQFDMLAEKWKQDVAAAKIIADEIDFLRRRIYESNTLNEGVVDVIKNYLKRGVLTATVLASLIASNHLNAQQLQQAGVPQQTITRAEEITKTGDDGDEVSTEKINTKLIRTMKHQNLAGALKNYLSLPQQEKQKLLTGLQTRITSLNDLDNQFPSIIGWVNKVRPDNIQIGQKSHKDIVVDTAYVKVTLPIGENFEFNSADLKNPSFTKQEILDSLNTFMKIDSIVIKASSSTLRNRGGFEGLTWMQGSERRANAIKELVAGAKYDLGGQGVNTPHTIEESMIKIEIKGDNGDGTSGPPSQYEVDPSTVQSYKERNIDAKFWHSAAKGSPLANKDDYKQFQYVNVIIFGQMVETDTVEIVNVKVVQMRTIMDVKVERANYSKGTTVKSCPVVIKDTLSKKQIKQRTKAASDFGAGGTYNLSKR